MAKKEGGYKIKAIGNFISKCVQTGEKFIHARFNDKMPNNGGVPIVLTASVIEMSNFNPLLFVPPYFLPVHIIIGYLVLGNLFLIFMKKELYKPRYLITFILETAENPSKTIRHLLKSD